MKLNLKIRCRSTHQARPTWTKASICLHEARGFDGSSVRIRGVQSVVLPTRLTVLVSAACLAASRTPGLVRFQLLGVRIELNAAPLLVQVDDPLCVCFGDDVISHRDDALQVLEHCRQLEEFNASQSKMGDGVLAG